MTFQPNIPQLQAFLYLESRFANVCWLENTVDGEQIIAASASRYTVANLADLAPHISDTPQFGWLDYELGLREHGIDTGSGEGRWFNPEVLLKYQGEDSVEIIDNAGVMVDFTPVTINAGKPLDAHPQPLVSDAEYAAQIAKCQAWIENGDSYLACLTTGYSAEPINPVATYLTLRERNTLHRGGFIRIGDKTLISISPERFIEHLGDTIRTSPIKGTAKRDSDPIVDRQNAISLQNSRKERAENTMVVDVCRNDLNSFSARHTVQVEELLAIHSYPAVHQLVSTVSCKMGQGATIIDALRGLFPAASMIGAPKMRAAELLRNLEKTERGTYSGCFGYVSQDVSRLSMTIRTVISTPEGTTIGVGGGITALSDPHAEVAEIHLKARALLDAFKG